MATRTHLAKQEEGQTESGVQLRSSDPGSPATNQVWINTTTKQLKRYNGTAIEVISSGVSDTAFGVSWDGVTDTPPSKNAVYDEVTARFNTSTGHKHDGTDSKKILATNLDSTGATTGQVPKANGSGGVAWGTAGGAGGINLLTLDSSFLVSKTDNSDVETSLGDWISYADAAGTSPVDMTGGTPNTTIARDTTSPLNGLAHLTMTVSSGATRQGEGVSCVANVPPAYRGKTVSFQFPFTLAGTVVDGDFTLFAYDVTNSAVITPYAAGKILGSSGTAIATFPIPTTCTQLRVGIHVARASNTGAVTIKFDDVKVTPDIPAMGMAGSDTQSFPMTITGTTTNPTKGTIAVDAAWYYLSGDRAIIHYDYRQSAAGSAGSGTYLFALPSGLQIDTTKQTLSTNGSISVGKGWVSSSADGLASTTRSATVVPYDSTHLALATLSGSTDVASLVGSGTYPLSGTNLVYSFDASVPVANRSSNVTLGQSSTFRISSYLANGTRVTTTPTALGQYRSYVHTINTVADGTDTAPTTGWTPSANDGMRLEGKPYNAAGTSGQPNRYEIFVGKNKNVRVDFYSSTGRTGLASVARFVNGSSEFGVEYSYDPVTGVIWVDGMTSKQTSTTGRWLGLGPNYGGSGYNDLTNLYFDITVSENALAVGIQAPRSSVTAYTGNGGGSTYTAVRRFVNSASQGSAIVYADSATAGATFTMMEDGVYDISYSDADQGSVTQTIGISINEVVGTTGTTSASSLTFAQGRRAIASGYAGYVADAHVSLPLRSGDVVRARFSGAGTMATTETANFTITKVSN